MMPPTSKLGTSIPHTPDERRDEIAKLIAVALVRCRGGEHAITNWTKKGVAKPNAESVYAHPSRPSPKAR